MVLPVNIEVNLVEDWRLACLRDVRTDEKSNKYYQESNVTFPFMCFTPSPSRLGMLGAGQRRSNPRPQLSRSHYLS